MNMNTLIEFVQNYRKENPTGWRKWIIGSVVALITLIVLTVFFVRESMRQREIAELKHSRDTLQETLRRNEIDVKSDTLQGQQETHKTAAEAALNRAAELDQKIQTLEAEHEANTALISALKSWEAVDAHVR
jgi:ABC-type transport system involved in cytochrome bd biosynthesis fused ATPase/permease subunit